MKHFIKLTIYTVLLNCTISCSDFLDREPNQLNSENFYQTDEEAEQGVNAIYNVFYNFYQNHVGFDVDCLSDDIIKGHGTDFSDYNSFNIGQLLASNPAIKGLWNDYYTGVFRANIVLDNVKNRTGLSEAKKKQVMGESYFLRAYFYYQLVQRYGGVPLILTTINQPDSPARAEASSVYAQIETDLSNAIDMLNFAADSEVGRPNKGTATCLLGLVYLSQNKFSEAYKTLKPVVENDNSNYNYSLIQDLSQMYQISNNNGPESVFEIQARDGAPIGQTVAYNHWVRPRGMSKLSGLGFPMPTESLYNEFEEGDKRLEATILKEGDFIAPELVDDEGHEILFQASWAPETGMNCAKYVKWVNVGNYQERSGQNKKLIRYAEVLLAFAEAAYAEGDSDGAWNAIKTVRQRAFGIANPPVYSSDFTTALRHERRVELATENRRYFDLIRWGIAEQVLTADCKKHANYNLPYSFNKQAKGLYPIPQSELDVNKNPGFYQNPGY